MRSTNIRGVVVVCGLAAGAALGCSGGAPEGDGAETEAVRSQTSAVLGNDSIAAYAAKCDQAIGMTVPSFRCDTYYGTNTAVPDVPVTNFTLDGVSAPAVPSNYFPGRTKCDRPDELKQTCDPGSKFQVISEDTNAFVVANCRNEGSGVGIWHDVAVIQYNKVSGATCFYQHNIGPTTGVIPAPSTGDTAAWAAPNSGPAGDACVKCHDNGPIIRSPYLTQLADAGNSLPGGAQKILPGANQNGFNQTQPYFFVGNNFAAWRAYKVDVPGHLCLTCHRLGVNNIGSKGTALDFALRAVGGETDASGFTYKNPVSPASPLWMLPNETSAFPDGPFHQIAALNLATQCASQRTAQALPFSSTCQITPLTGMPQAATIGGTIGWERKTGVTGGRENCVLSASGGAVTEIVNSIGDQEFGAGPTNDLFGVSTTNLNGLFGAPPVASQLSALVRYDNWNSFIWRNTSQHISGMRFQWGKSGWLPEDITSLGGGAPVIGDPAMYIPPHFNTGLPRLTAGIVYASGSASVGPIHRLKLLETSDTAWSDDIISTPAGAPSGASPVGYTRSDGADTVVYQAGTKIWELASFDNSTFTASLLSNMMNAVAAFGSPRPYLRTDGVSAVLYRDVNNHIEEMSFTISAGWHLRDLFYVGGIGNRATLTDPAPYIRADSVNAVLFVDRDSRHVFELELQATAFLRDPNWRWNVTDLTQASGAPSPLTTETPTGSVYSDGTTAVVYKGTNGHVYRMRFADGAWQPYDSSIDNLAP